MPKVSIIVPVYNVFFKNVVECDWNKYVCKEILSSLFNFRIEKGNQRKKMILKLIGLKFSLKI